MIEMPLKVDSRATQETAFTRGLGRDERVESGDTDFSLELMETYNELKSYRTLIKNFVGEAVNRMYQLHSQAGWDRMGRQKVYTTVRKIDRKLEEMAEKIRLGQSEQLDIIASHDAIRGMLVDLYM